MLDVSKVKVGDFLSETQYYKVLNVDGPYIRIVNERKMEFSIAKEIIAEGCYSNSQVEQTITLTRTELIEKLAQVGDTVFTVNYHKQPSADSINDAIESANKGKILPIATLKKLVKTAYKGEERTLTGYLLKTETGFGRSTVLDLDTPVSEKSRVRQVDHRTLNWLIHQNIKYLVK